MKACWLFLLLLLGSSTSLFSINTRERPYQLSYLINAHTSQDIQKNFNVSCCSSGYHISDIVLNLSLGFHAKHELSLEEARRFAVGATDIFLHNINDIQELRPYLSEYPYPAKKVTLSLNGYDSNAYAKRLCTSYYVLFVIDGTFSYRYRCKEGDVWKTNIVQEEPLEETRKIVAAQQTPVPSQNEQDVALPSQQSLEKSKEFWQGRIDGLPYPSFTDSEEKYRGSSYERNRLWLLDGYGTEIAKKYGMSFMRAGNPTEKRAFSVCYGLDFIDTKPKTLEQGKVLVRELLNNYFQFVTHDPKILKEHQEEYNDINIPYQKTAFTTQPQPEQLALRVGYWDEQYAHPKPPYLAQITCVDNKIYYYMKDPQTEVMEIVLTEPLQEALSTKVTP